MGRKLLPACSLPTSILSFSLAPLLISQKSGGVICVSHHITGLCRWKHCPYWKYDRERERVLSTSKSRYIYKGSTLLVAECRFQLQVVWFGIAHYKIAESPVIFLFKSEYYLPPCLQYRWMGQIAVCTQKVYHIFCRRYGIKTFVKYFILPRIYICAQSNHTSREKNCYIILDSWIRHVLDNVIHMKVKLFFTLEPAKIELVIYN